MNGNNNNQQTEPENNNPNQNNENNNKLSSNANLESLQINVEGISPRFNKNTTQYYLIIDDSIDNIKVTAKPENSNARVEVTGNTNLQIGMNTITINVIAQNGFNKKYLINVSKTDNPKNVNTNLENLAIENVILNPEFNPEVLEYTAEVGSDIEKLNILAVPEIEGANVRITGGEKLNFGDNIITINVTAKDGSSVKVYTINVYRKNETEEITEEEIDENTNTIDEVDNKKVETDIKKNQNIQKNENTFLWIFFWIMVIAVIAIIIYIIMQNKKKHRK